MKLYRYHGWSRFTRFTNRDGTFGYIWGPIGVYIYRLPKVGRWLDVREGIQPLSSSKEPKP